MKKQYTVLAIVCMSICLMAFKSNKLRFKSNPVKLEPKPIVLPEIKTKATMVKIKTKNHQDFLEAIGFKESGNRYDIVNKYGYMGRYQFGKSTLKGLGIEASKEKFLNTPAIQERAMQELLEHNQKKLRRIIKKYDNTYYKGIYVTESGILAAAHLGGQGNVKKFFRNGSEFKDGFGTSILTYMEKFSGYQLDLN